MNTAKTHGFTRLMKLVAVGDDAGVERFVAKYTTKTDTCNCSVTSDVVPVEATLNAQDDRGFTALHYAARDGFSRTLKLILGARANPDVATPQGLTPLMCAAYGGHDECVHALLASGASTDLADGDGVSALFVAAERRKGRVVDLLLRHNASTDAVGSGGASALLVATRASDVGIVRSLLEAGADAGLVDVLGVSPLEAAAARGHASIVGVILRYGDAAVVATSLRRFVHNLARASRPDRVAKYTLDAALRAVLDDNEPLLHAPQNVATALSLQRRLEQLGLGLVDEATELGHFALSTIRDAIREHAATRVGGGNGGGLASSASSALPAPATRTNSEASALSASSSASSSSGSSDEGGVRRESRVLRKFPASIFLWAIRRAVSLGVDQGTPQLEALWPQMSEALTAIAPLLLESSEGDLSIATPPTAGFLPSAATRRLSVLVESFIHVHSRPVAVSNKSRPLPRTTTQQRTGLEVASAGGLGASSSSDSTSSPPRSARSPGKSPPITSPSRPRSNSKHVELELLPRLRAFLATHRAVLLELIDGDPTLCLQLEGMVAAKKWLLGEGAAVASSHAIAIASLPVTVAVFASPSRRSSAGGDTSPRSPSSPQICGVDDAVKGATISPGQKRGRGDAAMRSIDERSRETPLKMQRTVSISQFELDDVVPVSSRS
jgi:hypothetical protein